MKKSVFTMIAGVGVGLAVMASAAFAADSTVVVSGNTAAAENQPGWLFNRDVTTATPFEFNNDQHSLGMGSLYVLPIGATAADKFIGENFVNTPIADVNTISYDFMIGSGGSDTQEEQFYMNVYANFGVSDDLKFYDCRYSVVPTVGSTAGFTTVTFDPTQAYPVTTRGGASASPFTCPPVPADMNQLSDGSNIRMFALNLGDTSTSDTGLNGYFDNVVVNTDGGVTTYDFEQEPAPTPTPTVEPTPSPTVEPTPSPSPSPTVNVPTSRDDCKRGGWMTRTTAQGDDFPNQGQCVSYYNHNSN